MSAPEDKAARLAELEAAKVVRASARRELDTDRKIAALELEAKLEKEHGVGNFAVLHTSDGVVAIALGMAVLHTKFMDTEHTAMDIDQYVSPCVVYPTMDEYRILASRKPGLPNLLAIKLMAIYQGHAKDEAGK